MKKNATTTAVTAVMAILAAACFTACSGSDDTTSKSGTVSLGTESTAETTVTTTAAAEDTDTDTDTTTTAETTTAAETTTTAEETTTTTTTTAETTTTTEETTTTTAETTEDTTTTTVTEVDANSAIDTLESKSRILYNGYEFSVGDKMSDVEANLGSQPAPSAEVASCLSGDLITQYYFYGMTIEVKDDVIFSVNIMDNGYYGDVTPQTTAGLACNMAAADAITLYGDSTSSDELNYYYTDGTYSMQVSFFNDAISSIWISDSSLD